MCHQAQFFVTGFHPECNCESLKDLKVSKKDRLEIITDPNSTTETINMLALKGPFTFISVLHFYGLVSNQ